MDFISTRNKNIRTSAAGAILRGIAPDGGLFVPDALPAFSEADIAKMTDMDYARLAAHVISGFLPGFSEEELYGYTSRAYADFRDAAVAPVQDLGGGLYSLELYHGPTCAFKDFALQLLPYLISASVKKCGDEHTVAILVATSGDTGKAALAGFADVPGTKICVFYPDGGVSDIQRLQMVTQKGDNVMVFGVNGNFDDAQTGVKEIFGSEEIAEELERHGVRLSSANSINWGRLAPQIAYYYSAYVQLLRSGAIRNGEKVSFVVPTGNFGDILAGYFAKKSGLPVDKLICASNRNNVLTDFIRTGVYDRNRHFYLTMSPSMDILISSNLERLLYLLSEDDALVASLMASLKATGRYDVGPALLEKLREEGFEAYFADEEQTADTIRKVWAEKKYLADPHTAVGLHASKLSSVHGSKTPQIVLSTASPFKFAAAMLRSLDVIEDLDGFAQLESLTALTGESAPRPLAELSGAEVRFEEVIEKEEMPRAVVNWLCE